MNKQQLFENIKRKKSFLCVGLDTDIKKIPEHLLKEEDPIFAFNKAIIDATADLCIAYKPNLAFYESMGVKGWIAFEKTVNYIKQNYPDQFIIADAKRGDIGNTSAMYARTFFEELDIDSVTVAPYMGEDSVTPFLTYEGKWVILLALTSNKGSHDFQLTEDPNGERLFEKVLRKSQEWGNDGQMMYVVGATQGRAFLIKTIAYMVKHCIVKMFDEPIKIIFHLQVDDNIRIFFKIDRLHLKHFFFQGFQLF